ncbi:MAG: flavodoxin family protein [Oligoflexia bacterium]|nr:flavodoxin family protein [Oligoflexia bacterium]
MMKKVVAIMGSYRKNGVIDSIVVSMLETLKKEGVEVIKHDLLDKKIEFCTNCRQCTQAEGTDRGKCIHNDDFNGMMVDIDSADGLILAAPTNFFTINALTKRFIERLVCFAYWPFKQLGPKMRIKHRSKKAIIVSSSAMPGLLGRIFTSSLKILKVAAQTLGAKVVGTLYVGSAISAQDGKSQITAATFKKASKLAEKLL